MMFSEIEKKEFAKMVAQQIQESCEGPMANKIYMTIEKGQIVKISGIMSEEGQVNNNMEIKLFLKGIWLFLRYGERGAYKRLIEERIMWRKINTQFDAVAKSLNALAKKLEEEIEENHV